jgi:triosephosphate isomerase
MPERESGKPLFAKSGKWAVVCGLLSTLLLTVTSRAAEPAKKEKAMSDRLRPLVAGNWKMNGLSASLAEIAEMARLYQGRLAARLDLVVCPPATLIQRAAELAAPIAIGGQDCHAASSGAHTGDISAAMLGDAGARFVIVGHSERRADHHETDAMVRAKAEAGHGAGLAIILCLGESEAEREAGHTLDVIAAQLEGSLPRGANAGNLAVAYEPVWAIGSGRTPTHGQIAEVHRFLRQQLVDELGGEASQIRLLYGGSVKPANARDLLGIDEVNGALVGGASLKAEDFMAIAGVYDQ